MDIKEDFKRLRLFTELLENNLSIEEIKNGEHKGISSRINSSLLEQVVLEKIKKIEPFFKDYLEIEDIPAADKASFYDIKLKYNNRSIFINIKITNMGSKGDNSSGWGPICYLLTGKESNSSKKDLSKIMKEILEKIKKNEYKIDNSLNYYFLVINKNTCEIFVNSLKTIKEFSSNPANPPYQINWTKNKEPDFQVINKNSLLFLKDAKKSLDKAWENDLELASNLGKIIDYIHKN